MTTEFPFIAEINGKLATVYMDCVVYHEPLPGFEQTWVPPPPPERIQTVLFEEIDYNHLFHRIEF